MTFARKSKYSVEDFLGLVANLRGAKNNSWGGNQTHESLRSNLIEEAYEVVEAIDLSDSDLLKKKLGDLLLQIVIHCNIEEKAENFGFEDIVDDSCKKIVAKNPHIFKENNFIESPFGIRSKPYTLRDREINSESTDGRRYYNIKVNEEEKEISSSESIKSVSRILPSLMRTTKVQNRAARAGFGVFSVEDALNESFERMHYLETLILDGKQEDYNYELGDLLFSITEVARLIGVDSESALYDSCERFKDEFLYKLSIARQKPSYRR